MKRALTIFALLVCVAALWIVCAGFQVSNPGIQPTGSITSTHCAQWADASGRILQDSGGSCGGTGNVTGAASSVNNDVVVFSGTGGKTIKDPASCTLTSTQLSCPQGSSGTPSLTFALDSGTGFYDAGGSDIRGTIGGDVFHVASLRGISEAGVVSSAVIGFGFDVNSGLADTAFSRDSADAIDCGNGSQGDKSCTLNLATLNPSAGIVGVSTNSSAAAGRIGQIVSSQVIKGSAVSLTSGTAANVTSVSLTAGDWDCSGAIDFTFGATTSVSNMAGSISQTSGAIGPQDSGFDSAVAAMVPTSANDATFPLPVFQELLSGTTTIFLVAKSTFTISTTSAYGTLRCRRIR